MKRRGSSDCEKSKRWGQPVKDRGERWAAGAQRFRSNTPSVCTEVKAKSRDVLPARNTPPIYYHGASLHSDRDLFCLQHDQRPAFTVHEWGRTNQPRGSSAVLAAVVLPLPGGHGDCFTWSWRHTNYLTPTSVLRGVGIAWLVPHGEMISQPVPFFT